MSGPQLAEAAGAQDGAPAPASLEAWLAAQPDVLAVGRAPGGGPAVAGVVRHGTRLARILLAAAPPDAGDLEAFAAAARGRGCAVVRAEIAEGDAAGLAAYREAGFRPIRPDVHSAQPARAVLRLERWLDGRARERGEPYFTQTTWFTCGPAALMLARHRLDASAPVDRRTEIRLWREATTIQAPGGPGGCDPFGLACAAARRGLAVTLVSTFEGLFFTQRIADAWRRDLMEFVQAEFRADARALGVAVEIRRLEMGELAATLAGGRLAIVLVDQGIAHGRPMPHWVLAYAVEDGLVMVDDPWAEPEDHETDIDRFALPIALDELDRMAWYGAPPYRAVLLLGG